MILQEAEVKSITSSVSADGKTAVACIHFLLNNAARHNASELVFNEELQQLGLPKEHAEAMCSILTLHAPAIRQRLIDRAFKSTLTFLTNLHIDFICNCLLKPLIIYAFLYLFFF